MSFLAVIFIEYYTKAAPLNVSLRFIIYYVFFSLLFTTFNYLVNRYHHFLK